MVHILLSLSLSILFFVAIVNGIILKFYFPKVRYQYIDPQLIFILNLYSMTLLHSLILSLLFSGSLAFQDIGPVDFACGL